MHEIDIHNFIDIPGYPDYKIKIATNEVLSLKHGKKKILANSIDKSGHYLVGLYILGKVKIYYLHDIVMLIKVGIKDKGIEVCHNDGNEKNNHPDNLRYGTKSDNMYDRVKHGRHHNVGMTGSKSIFAKPIYQYSLDGTLINRWKSMTECAQHLGISNSDITGCCRGRGKTAGGFVFRYA